MTRRKIDAIIYFGIWLMLIGFGFICVQAFAIQRYVDFTFSAAPIGMTGLTLFFTGAAISVPTIFIDLWKNR